ncbi:ABC-F type ribosomal protection protein [Chryseomicrobium excrementi]|uniref:ABC-F type ribosomal protection protein n=1 Tax=Chryseomicrobium excrementi TaxID=2041346 RepID=A0A2M9EZB9_9BACL|nr:ABC-F type ribosomal protection protein [Chryseomicrobium excrementi]PJK16555.1 ABC-F type ribosomal protection protein [Chryseomicrobium excrementi]
MEKICFELKNIELSFLDKEVLKIENLAIHQFDRIGIVGKNGAGKTTLMKLLTGQIEPEKGEVLKAVEFGHFKQMETPEKLDSEYDYSLLGKLNIPQNLNYLSGGEESRLKLVQLFSRHHEALLLDEPTTHLDSEGTAFVLNELRYYYGALIIISHDRKLLDELVTSIWEVEDGQVNVYTGNYSYYAKQKERERNQQFNAREQFQKEKSRLEKAAQEKMKKAEKITQSGRMSKKESKSKTNRMFESKSKGTGQKSVHRAAKAIEQRIDQLEEVDPLRIEKSIIFPKQETLELHNPFPIMANQLTLKFEDKVLLDEANFQFPRGKKIAILGPNGSGKSTLLKNIARREEALTISPKAKIGYFQQTSYRFTGDDTLMEYVKKHSDYDEGFLRSVLHTMDFTGTDIQKRLTSLSGGEAIRLQLCLLFLGSFNILLLDEPTNFLDLYAIQALETFINGYAGTILLVSHDQVFIENVVDLQYKIDNKKILVI